MKRIFEQPTQRYFFHRYVAPTFLVVGALAVALVVPLLWSKHEADRAALMRQESLLKLVVANVESTMARNQETVTVSDATVAAVQSKKPEAWLEANIGRKLEERFGHHASFVFDRHNKPIFGYLSGSVIDEKNLSALDISLRSILLNLREKLAQSAAANPELITIGASDAALFVGRPAIISAKPIVAETSKNMPKPGEEFVQISVRLLDDKLMSELRDGYMFDGLRFAQSDDATSEETSVSVRASLGGDTIGYFIWKPYRPGDNIFSQLSPVLMAGLGFLIAFVAILLPVLQRRSQKEFFSEEAVRHLALRDSLTDLPNRANFEDTLDRALLMAQFRRGSLALLYLDLDRFKQVNDTLGHPVGDNLINQFATRLKLLIRPGYVVSRIGGDEFAIIVPNIGDRESLNNFCQSIIEAMRRPFEIAETQVFISVSIGIACAPEHGKSRVELTRRADLALFNAKNTGRDKFVVFCPEMDEAVQQHRIIERDLREALRAGDQLEVYYQPLYSAATGRISGAEALIRWKHPKTGFVSPANFIPVAEDTGLISMLGEFVMREACMAAASWPIHTISVNVSALELRNPGFAARVFAILMAAGLHPHRLEIEVTESAITDDNGMCEQHLTDLRSMGVQIALDDFGTGFSSLARLRNLPVDRIKVDQSFVRGFESSESDRAIVKAIVELARAVNLKTTAEGVETTFQRDILREIGCDDLQGYLMNKPMPKHEFDRVLAELLPLPALAS